MNSTVVVVMVGILGLVIVGFALSMVFPSKEIYKNDTIWHTKSFKIGVLTIMVGFTFLYYKQWADASQLILTGFSVIFLREGIQKN